MLITKAAIEEYQEVRRFYHSLIDAMQGTEYHPMWQKDIYPSPEDLYMAVSEQSLFIGRVYERIAAAMVVNRKCNEEYYSACWPENLQQNEYMVIHMLGVHREFSGNGYAKEMVRYAFDYAEKANMKAIRLDVLKGNIPAEKLYEGMGFVLADTVTMFYEDTGRMEFMLYEYCFTGR